MVVHTFDVIGFYPNMGDFYGEPFCAACAPKHADNACADKGNCCSPWVLSDAGPIFRDSESDTPTHCVACEALIPHALTLDGAAYVWEALQIGTGRPEILAMWRKAYAADIAVV